LTARIIRTVAPESTESQNLFAEARRRGTVLTTSKGGTMQRLLAIGVVFAVGPPPGPPGPPPVRNFNNQTLRLIVHPSMGGDRLRVVLSHAFGTAPLRVPL
jgi:hypothetical protein